MKGKDLPTRNVSSEHLFCWTATALPPAHCQCWVVGTCVLSLSSQGLSQFPSIIPEVMGNVQCTVAVKKVSLDI